MFGGMLLKQTLKRTAGALAVLSDRAGMRSSGPSACILAYHRVVPIGLRLSGLDNWNVQPEMFERQIASLASTAECVPLLELPARLRAWRQGCRPLVSLTFDDGYGCIADNALPVLKRYRVPASIFVVTEYVGQSGPMPFDRWGNRNKDRAPRSAWRALDWRELELCVASGLVTVGSHSHRHINGREATAAALREEAERSRDVLKRRLGADHARIYAYPYGSLRLRQVSADYTKAVRDAGYELAVSTELGLVTPATDLFLLPRVETHGLDSPAILRAKTNGALLPYVLTDRLRRASRTA